VEIFERLRIGLGEPGGVGREACAADFQLYLQVHGGAGSAVSLKIFVRRIFFSFEGILCFCLQFETLFFRMVCEKIGDLGVILGCFEF
jgi:hypothetical protein